MISNWTKFKWPYAPMKEFTQHEPFPSDDIKPTYIDGLKKRKKSDRTYGAQALEALQRAQPRR